MGNDKKKSSLKKKSVIITLIIVIGIYIVISLYFANHFYLGSSINSVNVSGKTVDEAKNAVISEVDNYVLTIEGRDGEKDEIKGKDIDFNYNIEGKVKELKDTQSSLGWVSGIFGEDKLQASEAITFNEEKLKNEINKLNFLNEKNKIEPRNAKLVFEDNEYIINKEIDGNKVDSEVLYSAVVSSLYKCEETLDMDKSNCYVRPEYTEKSQEVLDAQKEANKYLSSNINIVLDEKDYNINKDKIKDWVSISDKFEVSINESKVKKYINDIASKYNTIGSTRNFKTTKGNTVTVSGGDYGKTVDTSEDIQKLIALIQDGKTVDLPLDYAKATMSDGGNDIGNTYVEIDLTGQHIWFYKNGKLICDGDVVTGNLSAGHGTPAGVYRLKYKQKDTELVGEDYRSPVSFWMPFNGGIGIHDASWRNGIFGGEIYKTSGSHGCVNAPYALAQSIYNNIEAGTPVVCYK